MRDTKNDYEVWVVLRPDGTAATVSPDADEAITLAVSRHGPPNDWKTMQENGWSCVRGTLDVTSSHSYAFSSGILEEIDIDFIESKANAGEADTSAVEARPNQ